MTAHPALVFLGGLLVVVLGAELLLRSATRIAALLGVRPIVIGLTVVSIGTSTPELAVGLTAVSEGRGSLAVGNIAGANILIILLVLGLSAVIRPLPIRLQSVKLDVPMMIGAAVALLLMSLDGRLTRIEGALLLLAAVVYTTRLVRLSRQETLATQAEFREVFATATVPAGQRRWHLARHGALLAAGMALTVLGADWLVAGAVRLAAAYGVSDAFIGLTIVALGTSSPELITTTLATLKDDRDVAIGNLIGSSIYNILVILGLILLAAPDGIAVGRDILWMDLPFAALVALVCLPVFSSDRMVSRTEGGFFVAAYLGYLGLLLATRT